MKPSECSAGFWVGMLRPLRPCSGQAPNEIASRFRSPLSMTCVVPKSLAVFDAGLYVGVRVLDESAYRSGVYGRSRSQLYMAHEFAGALQHAGRIGQRRAVKESYVYVRSENIDVAEGRIAQTGNRTAVMQKLADFVAALSHHLKPLLGDGSQFAGMRFHPGIDGGIALDGAVESEEVRFDRFFAHFDAYYRQLRRERQ